MAGPSNYVREKREAAGLRRLRIVKMLRENPGSTNLQLAKALGVGRETIAKDRKIMMQDVAKNTLTETESLRAEMFARLESLNEELELHRKSGKLPTSVIHEIHLITRSMIELLGVRRPVVEKTEVKHELPTFRCVIRGSRDRQPSPNHVWSEEDRGWLLQNQPQPLTLEAGDPNEDH